MQTTKGTGAEVGDPPRKKPAGKSPPSYPPIAEETRTHVPTDCGAYHLNRAPQTMRFWACTETGPIRPIRINGRLAWPVAGIRRILGVAE